MRDDIDDLIELLESLARLNSDDYGVRERVRRLVEAHRLLDQISKNALPKRFGESARVRILNYLLVNVGEAIDGEHLRVVGRIQAYARRIRELRTEYGWPILSGNTITELRRAGYGASIASLDLPSMRADQYCLVASQPDSTAPSRWKTAQGIRSSFQSPHESLRTYVTQYLGSPLMADELRFVAGGRGNWCDVLEETARDAGWRILVASNEPTPVTVGALRISTD